MKEQKITELDKLFLEVGTYRESSQFKELIQFVKKFPKIAPFNAMLLHVQKPGSVYVATATEWKNKFKRSIKVGARPLVILMPFGPVSFVFELGDTEGAEPFPEELLNPFRVEEGVIAQNDFDRLTSNLITTGIVYIEAEQGTSSAGFVQISESLSRAKIERPTKEIWVKILFDIVVNKNHNIETRFATLLHELGHVYCGHLGTPSLKWWGDRKYLRKNEKEFEAESVCWLVCERLGLKNPSAEYLSGYLDENKTIPNISVDTVLKAAGIIESMIKKLKDPRKEIIHKVVDLKKK